MTQTKKYDADIRSFKADNAELREELDKAQDNSVHKLLEDAKLRADYENLQRIMDRIPPKIVFAYSGRKPDKSRGQDTR